MTQVFVFDEKEPVKVLEINDRPELIAAVINSGNWEKYLDYQPVPTRAWQATQVGRLVVVITPQPPFSLPPGLLTARDYQLLQAFASGQSLQQAAYQLHLDPRTVRNYLHRLRQKLHAKTLPELLARAALLGLIQPDISDVFD